MPNRHTRRKMEATGLALPRRWATRTYHLDGTFTEVDAGNEHEWVQQLAACWNMAVDNPVMGPAKSTRFDAYWPEAGEWQQVWPGPPQALAAWQQFIKQRLQ